MSGKAKYQRWTKTDDAMLRVWWAGGVLSPQIAEYLGRTKCSVIGRINRLGLNRNTRVKPRIARLAAPRVERDPCVRCGVRGDQHAEQGCRHYRIAA